MSTASVIGGDPSGGETGDGAVPLPHCGYSPVPSLLTSASVALWRRALESGDDAFSYSDLKRFANMPAVGAALPSVARVNMYNEHARDTAATRAAQPMPVPDAIIWLHVWAACGRAVEHLAPVHTSVLVTTICTMANPLPVLVYLARHGTASLWAGTTPTQILQCGVALITATRDARIADVLLDGFRFNPRQLANVPGSDGSAVLCATVWRATAAVYGAVDALVRVLARVGTLPSKYDYIRAASAGRVNVMRYIATTTTTLADEDHRTAAAAAAAVNGVDAARYALSLHGPELPAQMPVWHKLTCVNPPTTIVELVHIGCYEPVQTMLRTARRGDVETYKALVMAFPHSLRVEPIDTLRDFTGPVLCVYLRAMRDHRPASAPALVAELRKLAGRAIRIDHLFGLADAAWPLQVHCDAETGVSRLVGGDNGDGDGDGDGGVSPVSVPLTIHGPLLRAHETASFRNIPLGAVTAALGAELAARAAAGASDDNATPLSTRVIAHLYGTTPPRGHTHCAALALALRTLDAAEVQRLLRVHKLRHWELVTLFGHDSGPGHAAMTIAGTTALGESAVVAYTLFREHERFIAAYMRVVPLAGYRDMSRGSTTWRHFVTMHDVDKAVAAARARGHYRSASDIACARLHGYSYTN